MTFDFIPQLTIAKFLQFSIQRVIGTKVLLGVGKYLAAAVKVMLVFVLVMLIPHLLDIRYVLRQLYEIHGHVQEKIKVVILLCCTRC